MRVVEIAYEFVEGTPVLVEGLDDTHPMRQREATLWGSSTTSDLSIDRERSNIALGGVVVGGHIGPVKKGEHTIKVLVEASLEPSHIGLLSKRRVRDQLAEADSDAAAVRRVAAGLGCFSGGVKRVQRGCAGPGHASLTARRRAMPMPPRRWRSPNR